MSSVHHLQGATLPVVSLARLFRWGQGATRPLAVTTGSSDVDVLLGGDRAVCARCYLRATLEFASDPGVLLLGSVEREATLPTSLTQRALDAAARAPSANVIRLPRDGSRPAEALCIRPDPSCTHPAPARPGRPGRPGTQGGRALVLPCLAIVDAEDRDDVGLWRSTARAANLGLWSPRPDLLTVGAADTDRRRARARCLGEAVERAALTAPPPPGARGPRGDHWHAPVLHRAPRQTGVADSPPSSVDMSDEAWWVAGTSLGAPDGVPLHVPTSAVWPGTTLLPDAGCTPFERTTSGTSAVRRQAQVARSSGDMSALLELIERDAVMSWWLHRRVSREVPDAALGPRARRLRRRLHERGVVVVLRELPSIAAPTVCCILTTAASGVTRCMAFGSAARTSLTDASDAASVEALQVWGRIGHGPVVVPAPAEDLGPCTEPGDHVRHFWATGHHALEWILRRGRWPGAGPAPGLTHDHRGVASLAHAVETSTGHPVVAVDITPATPRFAGWSVRRVVAPGLQPYYADESAPLLLPRTLRRDGTGAGRNPHPHPLA